MSETEQQRIEAARLIDHATILTPEIRQKLSEPAQRVYKALWFLGFTRDSQTLFVSHHDLSQRSHTALNYLPAMVHELTRAELIAVSDQRHGAVYRLLMI